MFASWSISSGVSRPARSAAVVNAEIRALWGSSAGTPVPAERERYQRLLVEWAAAVRAEIVEAA
jgi:hypothetical protein